MRTRTAALVAATAVCLGTLTPTTAQASVDGWADERTEAAAATNAARTDAGLNTLTLTTTLNSVAQKCAEKVAQHLATTGDLAHCDGSLPGIADYAVRMPKGWSIANENVSAHPVGARGGASVSLLVGSAPNRIILMTPGLTHMGVGVAEADGWRIYVHNYGAYASSPGPEGRTTTRPRWLPEKIREVWGP